MSFIVVDNKNNKIDIFTEQLIHVLTFRLYYELKY